MLLGLSRLHSTCPEGFCEENSWLKIVFHPIWTSSGSLWGNCSENIQRGWRNCVPHVQKNSLSLKIVLRKLFPKICGHFLKKFWRFPKSFSAGLSILHSTCPLDFFEWKCFVKKFMFFLYFCEKWSVSCSRLFGGVVTTASFLYIATIWAKKYFLIFEKLISQNFSDNE